MISFFLKESGCILEEIIAKLIYNYHQENLRKGVFSKCLIVVEALLVQYERKRIGDGIYRKIYDCIKEWDTKHLNIK